jgi:hypothetical protein
MLYITSAYVSIRKHTSAYVSIRQHTSEIPSSKHVQKIDTSLPPPLSVCIYYIPRLSPAVSTFKKSILRSKSSPLRKGEGAADAPPPPSSHCPRSAASLEEIISAQHASAYVSIHHQHTSAYISIRQHTSAYVSILQHTSA